MEMIVLIYELNLLNLSIAELSPLSFSIAEIDAPDLIAENKLDFSLIDNSMYIAII
jgi:hypothetical protein